MSPYIQVPVLEEHVPKVYELLAQLGQADSNGSGGDSKDHGNYGSILITQEDGRRVYFRL